MKCYCPICQSEQEYYIVKKIIKEFKGVVINIEEQVPICKKCENELIVNSIEDDNLNKIYNKYRKIKNIISPTEIINLRNKYNISQRELTSILGLGKMTINRYENGALPSKPQSDYLKLILKDEIEFLNKAKEAYSADRITIKTFGKIENIINTNAKSNNSSNTNLKSYIESELQFAPDIYNGFNVLDLEKLQNLISYISSKVTLYLTSLNKYLWFIDMISYYKRTKSITGLTYVHEQFGPVIYNRRYEEISKLEDKFKREDTEYDDGSIRSKIISNNNFDLDCFSSKELEIINYVIDILKNKSASEISNLSHKEIGWKNTNRFEKISFEYADNLQILK